jgi:hypothetical protein
MGSFHTDCIMHNDVWSPGDITDHTRQTERCSVQHCIAAVEMFNKTESATAIQRGFLPQFQRSDASSHNILLCLVPKQCQENQSRKDSKEQGHPRSTCAPDNVEWARDAILQSQHVSARCQLVLRLRTVHRILHDLYCHE